MKGTTEVQTGRQNDERVGDCPATVFEVQRFTPRDHAQGKTAGWRQWSDWILRGSVTWAWFRREVDEEED